MSALELRDHNKYRFGFTIMYENRELLLVEWNPLDNSVPKIHTVPISCKKHWAIPNGLFSDAPSLADFDRFLESRSFDRDRVDMDELLKKYDLPEYYPLGICKKSYGRKYEDLVWIRFDGMEDVVYDDIKLR